MRIARLLFMLVAGGNVSAQTSAPAEQCNAPLADAITHINVTGRPVDPIPTRDGCWIFLSVNGTPAQRGVVVFHRANGRIEQRAFHPLDGMLFGMVLTHDEKLLIVAAGTRVAFLDVDRLERRGGNPVVGTIQNAAFDGTLLVNVTADDKLLFISQERSRSISVVDLARARKSGYNAKAIIGTIPTGDAPVSIELSNDGALLYVTSQNASASVKWPSTCIRAQAPGQPPSHSEGSVSVVDVARAATRPDSSVLGVVRAGCNPVRLALSPDGATAYVSARTDNTLLALDTKRMLSDPTHVLIGTVPVGDAPVGVAVVDSGRKVVVTNSNRFAGATADQQTLSVVDASRVSQGSAAVLGEIPAGGFPRQLHVTADGNTLLISNFSSGTLEVVDLRRLPLLVKSRH